MSTYFSNLIDINGLPLLACLVVSGVLVYLGMHVIERKVIFVDLALAQIAALGVMWAILMGYDHEVDTLPVTLYSLAFTAAGALVFSITRTQNERVPHEALIGIIYVAASAATRAGCRDDGAASRERERLRLLASYLRTVPGGHISPGLQLVRGRELGCGLRRSRGGDGQGDPGQRGTFESHALPPLGLKRLSSRRDRLHDLCLPDDREP